MKSIIEALLQQSLQSLIDQQLIPAELMPEIRVDRAKDKAHGDFATGVALSLAKPCKMAPNKLAQLIVEHLPSSAQIEQVVIAGPGFINFFVSSAQRNEIISRILKEHEQFARKKPDPEQRIIIEFVSANPTGPLHVGHGRSAAFGASLAEILTAAGYTVYREYYVNDAGRQMDILAVSVWLRYLEIASQPIVFPSNAYKGDYVKEMAQLLYDQHQRDYVHDWYAVSTDLPADEPQGGDKEHYIDAMIVRAKVLLGEAGFTCFHAFALNSVLDDIKDDLAEFNVIYENWFSEHSLLKDGSIDQGIAALKQAGHTYEQAGALWFKATDFGDEKDRVLVRANGQTTYFASDVAYHWNKYNRGFTRVINVFGADHHGYISRLNAAVQALGHDKNALDILLVQFAILFRAGQRVQMSTRSGSFVTLRELREEVGNDAARFFYVMRKPEQHMDFDLDLAKSQSSDNPVYYVQYAHARICSIFRQLHERGFEWSEEQGLQHVDLLTEPHEQQLIDLLNAYEETLLSAAASCEPHQLAYYLRELATALHSYYNAVPLLSAEDTLRCARLCLTKAVAQILKNGLQLLGVSAPESM